MRSKLYVGFFFMTCLDFWQVILSGTFRALEKVEMFSKFNFVSYFIIILPCTYFLAFHVGEHVTAEGKTIKGLGQMGTWYSFMIGLTFQLIMEISLLVFYIDWK